MKTGVVGLGLIGGSIFKSLQVLGYDVVGISTSQGGKYKNIYSDWKYLSECDVVFVCSPMNRVVADLKDLENYVSNDTIVADVSSLKGFVSKEDFSYNFIPSHPMAGTEFSGFEHSFDGLFKGAKWVLTPNDGIVPDMLKKIITDMGAKIVVASPFEHDEAVALVSHMPLVLSQALFLTANDNGLAKTLAASGFRDMTRLALSSEEMACDMVEKNSENIQKAILKLYANIGGLIKDNYPEKIHEIKQEREKMYKDGVNVL